MSFKPLSETDKEILRKVYYDDLVQCGRDRLYFYVKDNYPHFKGSQRATLDFLKHQKAHQMQQRPMKHTTVAPLKITKEGYLQADLIIMSPNYKDRGFEAILLVVDGYTKKLFCKPLRTQKEDETVKAMKAILDENPTKKVTVVQNDRGAHFQAKFTALLESRGIKHFYSKARTPTSNSFAERFVQSVKRALYTGMESRGDKKWVEYLPRVVDNLNNLRSFATGKTPNQMEQLSEQEHELVGKKITATLNKRHNGKAVTKPLLIGQKVRIRRDLGKLGKAGSKGYWSEHTYEVVKRINSSAPNILPTYKLKAENGHIMGAKYSRTDLLTIPPFLSHDTIPVPATAIVEEPVSVDPTPDPLPVEDPTPVPEPRRSLRKEGEYLVDYIGGKRRRKVKGKYRTEYLVYWVGYGKDEATYEPVNNLKNAKDAIAEFERIENKKK